MGDSIKYKVLDIIRGTTVDGPGLRTSIYLSGCDHNCMGCHNPQSHDPGNGSTMTLEEIMEIVEEEDFDVTLSGGDPLFRPLELSMLIKALKENRRNVWVYTGFTWDEIINSSQLSNAIQQADVVVDGRFDINLKDTDLRFKGSSNQRIIDVRRSFESGKVTEFNFPDF